MSGRPMGDGAWRFDRPPDCDPRVLFDTLARTPGVVDVIVTEEHVAVTFDPDAPPPDLESLTRRVPLTSANPSSVTTHVVRVRYDGEDLAHIAERTGVDARDVATLHAQRTYDVKMIGFLPGFAYLGDLDPRLVVPRRETARVRVPAHSVAIAATYTAVYPFASPGGWHIIGTALDFTPLAFALGDRVRFEPA